MHEIKLLKCNLSIDFQFVMAIYVKSGSSLHNLTLLLQLLMFHALVVPISY